MTCEWQTLAFSEAVEINPAVRLKLGEVYPFVDMQAVDPNSRTVLPSELRPFSGGGARFQSGDTLMARITPCLENGKIARFFSGEQQCLAHGSTEFIVIRGKKGVTDSAFVYYLTRSELVRGYAISQMTGTSGRQRVPTEALAHLYVPIPPLAEQQRIAQILGALDDKIELNRRMNETLEAMARAIFKSWFVDFEPVRAKMEGRWRPGQSLPGLPADLYDLFPDSLEDSALGRIPRGWQVGTIGDEFNITMGQSPPGDTYNECGDGLPFFQGRADFGFRFPARRVYCTQPTRTANAGDTLVSVRLVSVRAPVGDLNMAEEHCCIGRGVAAMRHKQGGRTYTYYAGFFMRDSFLHFEAQGTVFGSMGKQDFQGIPCLIPDPDTIGAFERVASPIDAMIEVSERQSRMLAAIRDALLPKLISGELRVGGIAHSREQL
jgi:type I restriction enzyme S subunit